MTKGPFNEEEITPPIGDCIEVRVESALAATQTIDYYALLAGAVRGLSKDTAALRHALYERGEIALIREIQKLGSFLTDDEITLQRLSFHEAVQKVEMECVLRSTTCASSVKVGSQERKLHVGASAITEGVTVETESNLNVA